MRRTSARAARSTASRPTNYYARGFSSAQQQASAASDIATPTTGTQPGFFPAITHFTDAADALPREVMRHFSMLKEVEAKLHGPEEELARLAASISNLVEKSRSVAKPGNNGKGNVASEAESSTKVAATTPDTQQEQTQLFRQLNYGVALMAPMLEEKIAVLSTANMTLARQLDRMESSYMHIPDEVSHEARLGSSTHWAYTAEKETKKAGNERTRREVAAANNLAAAAAAVEDLAAARSEARREAMLAKKGRQQHVDSDFEERHLARKPTGKGRGKHADPPDGKPVGPGPGQPGPGKKRKNAAGGAAMERSISAAVSGARAAVGSPTPGVEPTRKRKNPPGPVPGRKRAPNLPAQSPRLASSPLMGTFSIKDPPSRPNHGRGRQNSQSSLLQSRPAEPAQARPSSSASNKPLILAAAAAAEPPQPQPQSQPQPQPQPQAQSQPQAQLDIETTLVEAPRASEPPAKPTLDQATSLKHEEAEVAEDVPMTDADQTTVTIITTRAGRVSKTATPVVGAFPETAPRAGRGQRAKDIANASHASSESGERVATADTRTKRRRNGTAKANAAAAESEAMVARGKALADDEDGDKEDMEGDGEAEAEGEADGDDEPRYCYCYDFSYGEMVACDNETCEREWFHLRCAGLKEAPGEDCKFDASWNWKILQNTNFVDSEMVLRCMQGVDGSKQRPQECQANQQAVESQRVPSRNFGIGPSIETGQPSLN
jgi:hypothetical protein